MTVRVDPVRHIPDEGSVTVVDLAAGKVKAEIMVELHPSALAVSPDKKVALLTFEYRADTADKYAAAVSRCDPSSIVPAIRARSMAYWAWSTRAEIKKAWQTWGQVIGTNDSNVFGGKQQMLATNFGDVGQPMFLNPPKCYMHGQASFMTSFFDAYSTKPQAG